MPKELVTELGRHWMTYVKEGTVRVLHGILFGILVFDVGTVSVCVNSTTTCTLLGFFPIIRLTLYKW